MQGLLDGGGVRAVEEYLAAVADAYGESYAAPLRRWWRERRGRRPG
jgi:hypothetical protein